MLSGFSRELPVQILAAIDYAALRLLSQGEQTFRWTPHGLMCNARAQKEKWKRGFFSFLLDLTGRRRVFLCNSLSHSSAGMCNPRNYSDTPPTSKSTVEELHEPIPSLFRALTEGDTQLNWNIVSFPVAEELSHHENLVSFLETVNQPQHQNVSVPSNNVHAPYSSDKGKWAEGEKFLVLPPVSPRSFLRASSVLLCASCFFSHITYLKSWG